MLLPRLTRYAEVYPTFRAYLEALNQAIEPQQENREEVAEVLLNLWLHPEIQIRTNVEDHPILKPLKQLSVDFFKRIASLTPLTYKVFVYGTLKRGFPLSTHLQDQKFIGEYRTKPNYRLFMPTKGWFPMMVSVEEGGVAIEGELWELDDKTMLRLDRAEGPLYEREFIELDPNLEQELVEVYLYKYEITEDDLKQGRFVDCGNCWQGVDFHRPKLATN